MSLTSWEYVTRTVVLSSLETQAIYQNKLYFDSYLNLGMTYFYTDKVDQSIYIYQKALRIETG